MAIDLAANGLSKDDTLIIEIMSLAYKANLATDYAVFVSFDGHVSMLRVAIAKSKKEYQFKLAETYLLPSCTATQLERFEKLERIRGRLQRLLDTGDIAACGMATVPECHDLFIL
ncbi:MULTISPECIES: hypothetical protein [unclassified Pseudovibrio]|uniref:hypothetical protein n=1 Tax=unclassified Pseudovibrio TaxID=2627060 RepID=UPI00070A17D5|nr:MULTISPECIES: hypothetical protein [unclassified Pseudovibrio]KZK99179.1 hypothetical protein PsAD26_04988 [Pseudovibrio sp. Ad26]